MTGTRALVLLLALSVPQLPAPFATPWFRKITRVVAMPEGHHLTVPSGFRVNLFADHLQFVRFMALAPNGDVFLAEPVRNSGVITILRDADNDGVAETRETFATGLNRPFGLAFWKNYLYVGNNDSVVRFAYKSGQTKAEGAAEKLVDLPPSSVGQAGRVAATAGRIDAGVRRWWESRVARQLRSKVTLAAIAYY
jgi:glucose/arabinose dehydrogenase